MGTMKKIIKKAEKNVFVAALSMGTLMFTFYTIARAVTEDSSGSSVKSETLDYSTDAEKKLTNEEIDKIVEDLKASGDIDNILDKLDEIIQRAKLIGNTALQDYATNMKEAYELQKQLDSVKSLIEAMKKKNSAIAAIDEQVSKIISSSTVAEDLQGAVSDEALLIVKSLSDDDFKTLKEFLAEIESFIDLRDVTLLTVQQRSLLDFLILSEIIDNDMVEDEKLETAKDTLSVAATILQSYARSEYSDGEYQKLIEGSEAFASKARKGDVVLPEKVMFFDGHFNLKHPPIMYDGHILLAIDDLYQYVDGTIEYMYNNATMVIQSPNKTVEIVSGKNIGYVNDEPKNMVTPILNYDNTIYMSGEFFADAYDIGCKYDAEHEFLIFYNNLVQLENPSVPNQINKG